MASDSEHDELQPHRYGSVVEWFNVEMAWTDDQTYKLSPSGEVRPLSVSERKAKEK